MKSFDENFIKKLIPYVDKVSDNDPINTGLNQALFVYFNYGFDKTDKLFSLMYELINFIEKHNLGVYDGHELALDHRDGILYMYSSNVEKLFSRIKPILEQIDFMKDAKINMRFGPLESRTNEITIQLK